jgi:glutamate:GABA antiporter
VANPINSETIKPNFSNFSTLNLLATIAFAFAGLELASTMGDEVENPRRNLPRSIFVSAPLIAFVYILGTGAMLCLVPNQEINLVAGFLQAISLGAQRISANLWWLAPMCAALYTVATIGGVGAWLIGPARVAFVIGLDRYFPREFGRVHPRWHTPYVAILVQGILATIFQLLSVLGEGTTVEEVYLIMLDMQILIYFIPYLYLFVVFIMHRLGDEANQVNEGVIRAPGGKTTALIIGLSGLLITIFAMILATFPTGESVDPWRFRAKVIGGAALLILMGGLIYWRAKKKEREGTKII